MICFFHGLFLPTKISGQASGPEWLLGQHPRADGAKQFVNADGNPAIAENEAADTNTDSPHLVTEGTKRIVRITLKKLLLGSLQLDVSFRAARTQAGDDVAFVLPAPAPQYLSSTDGKLLVLLDESLRAEVSKSQHLQPMPLRHITTNKPSSMARLKRSMAFRFRGIEEFE